MRDVQEGMKFIGHMSKCGDDFAIHVDKTSQQLNAIVDGFGNINENELYQRYYVWLVQRQYNYADVNDELAIASVKVELRKLLHNIEQKEGYNTLEEIITDYVNMVNEPHYFYRFFEPMTLTTRVRELTMDFDNWYEAQ